MCHDDSPTAFDKALVIVLVVALLAGVGAVVAALTMLVLQP